MENSGWIFGTKSFWIEICILCIITLPNECCHYYRTASAAVISAHAMAATTTTIPSAAPLTESLVRRPLLAL